MQPSDSSSVPLLRVTMYADACFRYSGSNRSTQLPSRWARTLYWFDASSMPSRLVASGCRSESTLVIRNTTARVFAATGSWVQPSERVTGCMSKIAVSLESIFGRCIVPP